MFFMLNFKFLVGLLKLQLHGSILSGFDVFEMMESSLWLILIKKCNLNRTCSLNIDFLPLYSSNIYRIYSLINLQVPGETEPAPPG